jgi:hypothetical protein
MENTKLISLLKTFDKKEFEDFGGFVYSPYFNSNKKAKELYGIFRKCHPVFNCECCHKESVYKHIFRNENYTDSKLRVLFHDMLKLGEDFLGYQSIKQFQLIMKRQSLIELRKRMLDKHFEGKLREMEELLRKIKTKDTFYFFNNYVVTKEKRINKEIKKPLGKRGKFYNEITEEIDNFIVYIIVKMLKYFAVMLNLEKQVKIDFEYKFFDTVVEHVKRNQYPEYPVIKMIFDLIMLEKSNADESVYKELKVLALKHYDSLEYDDARLIFSQLYNYSKSKYIEGKEEYRQDSFEIMKEMVKRDILPTDGKYISDNTFLNVVSMGLIENETDWTNKFIQKFEEKISPYKKTNVMMYCNSLLNYKKGNYEEALKNLIKVKTEDFYYYLRVKNHLLKIFYELNRVDDALIQIDAFRHYLLTEKQIPEFTRNRFIAFTKNLKKTIKLKEKKDILGLKKLKAELLLSPEFENKTWLINKIKDLIN